MIQSDEPLPTRKRGGQPGNQNARKRPLSPKIRLTLTNTEPKSEEDLKSIVYELVNSILASYQNVTLDQDCVMSLAIALTNITVRLARLKDAKSSKVLQDVIAEIAREYNLENMFS